MPGTVIKVENISKQYRLGNVGTGSLSHDINRVWHRVRRKGDPYLKIGEENDRSIKGNSNYVWALRDINFEVKKGEVMGIIGRNGAGKSTLLKILSRTTSPTSGCVKIKGRVASLLEVGTGFHPELTGRENIFLNGAILGMAKQEIKRKFDEIVDFAGVEKYIDTPVKRYSSGMYVRLAFGVAAHLEPEILIIDEVLAVGDAEFQKKAVGKMKDVSNRDGRTVLFVSHNMAAVKNLCTEGIVMQNGKLVFSGDQNEAINFYQKSQNTIQTFSSNGNSDSMFGNTIFNLIELKIFSEEFEFVNIESGFSISLEFKNKSKNKTLGISAFIINDDELVLFEAFCLFADNGSSKEGIYSIEFKIPGNILNAGWYSINLVMAESQKYILWKGEKVASFEIENTLKESGYNLNRIPGLIRPDYQTKVSFSD